MIHIVTYYTPTGAYKEIGLLGASSKEIYAARQGYEFHRFTEQFDPKWNPSWQKVYALLKVMRAAAPGDWLFWSDADSILLNHRLKLDRLVGTNADLIISKDGIGINAGEFLIRCSDWSIGFLESLFQHEDQAFHWEAEQQAMKRELAKLEEPRVAYVSKRKFNSYMVDYRKGDFMIHFAGEGSRGQNYLLKLMREWYTKMNLV
jgi:hypothetical protein